MESYFRLLCISVLMVCVACQTTGSCSSGASLDADVIIIGAGMSGISAAQTLQENGIQNILILEGSNRVGGRVKSTQFGGVTVSVGATWIQGIDQAAPELHPLYQIGQRCNGLRGFYQDYDSITTYNMQGSEVPDENFRWDEFDAAAEAVDTLAEQLESNGECANTSLRYGFNVSGWTPLTAEDNFVEWVNQDFCTGEPPDSENLCLTRMGITYESFTSTGSESGDYFVTDPDGFDKIIRCLADEVTANEQTRLQYNSVVTEVNWSEDLSQCTCVTATVNNTVEEYCGAFVISTVSVGVLQSGSIQFIPELPQMVQGSLGRFRLARYIHIIMEFAERFWDETEFVGYVSDTRGYFPYFVNLNITFPENPNIFMAAATGEEVDRIHAQTDAETIAEIESLLSTLYPGRNTTVVNYLIPNWIADPLTRGSFSYPPVDLNIEDFTRLSAPVGNLYFSGEAFSRNFSGFIHGAYFAGIDTAERVVDRASSSAVNLQVSILVLIVGMLCYLLAN